VRLDVTRAFWALVVARETQRVVDESLARMDAHVRDVRNQLDAGLVPPNDVLSAQAQDARQRMLSIQARTTREVAEADLARLVGLDPGAGITPLAALEPPEVQASADALVADARDHRPERRALEERLAAAEARVQAAQSGRRPTVALAGGVDYARPNPRIFPRVGEWRESWDAGVNVSWPLFDGGRTRAESAEAEASVRAARARLDEFDSTLALEIRQRLSELDSNRAALDAADAAVQVATEARRVVGDRFAAGVATSTDVVDAQVAILQAELDRTQAIASARLSEARLNRAIGR
jgi:outer membrane protein TolC